jgi:outer membrane receptor protein involved in Fe transport
LRRTVFIILILITTLRLLAQQTGSIRGRVIEKGKALEFVNVYVKNQNDTLRIVAGSVSDSLGQFIIEALPPGSYHLTGQIVGYAPARINVSVLLAQSVDIGELELHADVHILNSVEVSALRNSIQKTDEGFVINASANITQIGGTAADLLKNMPGVLVDSEGELTLRGKTPLTLINGRVSGITGVDRSAQLQRIPASNIERIEIINNPSAKYDADAEGGIINIILKKSEGNGTNGAFAVGAGFGDRYRLNASLLVNHKSDKWNFGAGYDNWYTTRTRTVTGDRINYDIPDEYYLTQSRFDERLIFYQNAKANIDFMPTEKSTISFEALWAFPGEDNHETLNNTLEDAERNFTNGRQRYSKEIRRSHTLEWVLNYNKRFNNPDKHLLASISSSIGNDKENTDITSQSLSEENEEMNDFFLQRTHTYENSSLTNIAFDYTQPFKSKGLIETGYNTILRFLNSDFERASEMSGDYVIDPLNTNIFEFNEQIHAVYAQYTGWTGEKSLPRWKYSFGLRAEQVLNEGSTQDRTTDFENDYFNLFPSANLFYYTKKQNNVKLSYSRRINRPGLGQLNPFIDITDTLNQHGGNPNLKPELIHSLELGYNHSWNKASLSVIGFYRERNNGIFQYAVLDDNGVALSQPMNFGKALTQGLEVIASAKLFPPWSINFSYSAYLVRIADEAVTGISKNQTNWYAKLSNDLALVRNSKLQITGNYTSPSTIPQGESIEVYYVDFGFQQKILKGRGRLGLTVTDIFNTQQYGFSTSDYNFQFDRTVKLDTRAIMFTFGYAFGTSLKEKLMENRFKND